VTQTRRLSPTTATILIDIRVDGAAAVALAERSSAGKGRSQLLSRVGEGKLLATRAGRATSRSRTISGSDLRRAAVKRTRPSSCSEAAERRKLRNEKGQRTVATTSRRGAGSSH
jgi:hypothetical protein